MKKNSIFKKLFSEKEIISDIIILALIEIYILSFFDISLILKDSILAGGDSASHYAVLHYLAKTLLPNLRIIGWDHGNFTGYPLFQFYFPLPFLFAAVLGFIIPLTVALKITTFAGILTLPVFTYFCFKKLNYSFPVPVISSILTLTFLFNESYTMFGGNVLSTFAGEFCYGISLSILVLYIGSLYEGIKEKHGVARNSLLLSICGLCHAIPFMIAVTLPLFFLIRKDRFKENLKYLLKVNVLAFILMGFWIIPMMAKLSYTTPIYMIWNFTNIKDLLPPLITPFIILSLLRIVFSRFKKIFSNEKLYYFLYILAVSVLLYANSHILVVPDIRFLPLIYLIMIFISLDLISYFVIYIKPKIILSVLLLILTGYGVNYYVKDARSWFKWNYEGYEGKQTWETFFSINQFIKGTYNDPRVAYEKTPAFNAFGSDRVFESIPLFAGRQTLEGLHYGSAISAKIISFFQTEFSKEVMSPVAYIFSRPDIEHLSEKFRMFNINQIIVASETIKGMLSASNEFKEAFKIKNFAVFQLLNYRNHYIEPVKCFPVVYTGKDWREEFSKWFKKAESLDVPLIPSEYISDEDLKYLKFRTDSYLNLDRFRKETIGAADCRIEEKIEPFKISFTTSCPGIPHLVKFSYFPNWKVKGADKIYPVSPCFMLVIPKGREVVLTYCRSFYDIVGIICSFLGIAFVILLPSLKKTDIKMPETINNISNYLLDFIFKLKNYLLCLLVLIVLASTIYSVLNRSLAVRTYLKGVELFNKGRYEEAINVFQKITKDERYDLSDTVLSLLFEGRCYIQLKDFDKGIDTFRRILTNYPYSRFTSEAYYEIGMANLFQNKKDEAKEFFEKAAEAEKGSNFAKYAREKLEEMKRTSD